MTFRLRALSALCLSGMLAGAAQSGDAELAARCSLTDEIVVEACVEALKDAESVSDPYMRKLHLERAIKAMEDRARALPRVPAAPGLVQAAKVAESEVPAIYLQDKLPRNLVVEVISKLLSQLRPEPVKNEFETTVAFESRHSAWAAKPFKERTLGPEAMAFDVIQGVGQRGLQLTYDADQQEMQATLPLKTDTPAPGAWLESFFTGSRLGVRNAKTVMGVPFRVESWTFMSAGFSLQASSSAISLRAPMATAVAQRLKRHLRVLAVVRPEVPFAVFKVETETASLSSPTESRSDYIGLHGVPLAFLLYDPRDGRVYARSVGPF